MLLYNKLQEVHRLLTEAGELWAEGLSFHLCQQHGDLWWSRLIDTHPKLLEQDALELICHSPVLDEKHKIYALGSCV